MQHVREIWIKGISSVLKDRWEQSVDNFHGEP